jgi:flagellar protein FlgJ
MLASDQTRMYQSMLDQQLAQTLAQRGATGLAALIEQQLARTLPGEAAAGAAGEGPGSRFGLDTLRNAGRQLLGVETAATAPPNEIGPRAAAAPAEFASRIWPHALEASRATGIPAQFIVAQAALESGWGRAEIRRPDGSPSYNLFNIKAGPGWDGATVEAATTEYANGAAQPQNGRFRVYSSYADAFADYASLLKASPRYARVLGQQDAAAFARGLQQAGYASDPMYAEKLIRIIGSDTLRRSLAG